MKNTKKNNANFDFKNEVLFNGTIKNVLVNKEKVSIYNVEIPTETTKGNIAKAWVKVVDFEKEFEFEEGDNVYVSGTLNTTSYDGKKGKVFETRVIANEIKPLD